MNFEAEKRRRIREYALEHPQKRQIDIARDLGVARATVQRSLSGEKISKPTMTQKVLEYIKQNDCATADEIRMATGVSCNTIHKVAEKYGYQLNTRSKILREQIKDYVTVHPEGFTTKEIADEFGCTTTSVRRILNDFEDDGFRCLHLLISARSRSKK